MDTLAYGCLSLCFSFHGIYSRSDRGMNTSRLYFSVCGVKCDLMMFTLTNYPFECWCLCRVWPSLSSTALSSSFQNLIHHAYELQPHICSWQQRRRQCSTNETCRHFAIQVVRHLLRLRHLHLPAETFLLRHCPDIEFATSGSALPRLAIQ
jgi:hypothetical protein